MNKLFVKLGVTGVALLVGCDKGGTPSQTSKAPPTSISMDAPPPSTVDDDLFPVLDSRKGSSFLRDNDEAGETPIISFPLSKSETLSGFGLEATFCGLI